MNAIEMHVILITILLNKVTKTNLMLSFVAWNLFWMTPNQVAI
jgi:hypothetical protein